MRTDSEQDTTATISLPEHWCCLFWSLLTQTRRPAVIIQVIHNFPQPFRTVNGMVTETGPKPQPFTSFEIHYSQIVLPFIFIILVISNNVKLRINNMGT